MLAPANIMAAWSFPVVPLVSLALLSGIYICGFVRGRRTRPEELPPWRAVCFLSGILSIWVAIASPIDALDDFLLTAHMIQHLILMSVAPPLLILGAPAVPLLRGLPRWSARVVVGPLLQLAWLQRVFKIVSHPAFAWLSMNIAYLGWHLPRVFELALHSESWHTGEHLCFFVSSSLFWWIVIQPWPSQAVWPRWSVIPFLLTADIANTGLSAFLVFCGRVLYPTYADAPRVSGLSALSDQMAAGAEMWVLGSIIFLAAVVAVFWRMLHPKSFVPIKDAGRLRTEHLALRHSPLR
jgi:putative membrane protein